ncbi:MAG: toprim domain-containing protein, partial [bacterium]|nr:toprim domain-containing protein [bacterium]
MTIQEVKQNLSINIVLNHYGLKMNRNKMLSCPFHEDKTPSMQIYEETDTAYCFSSNCKLHGKSIDQIDFILYKEGVDKKEAIEKAKQLAGIIEIPKAENSLEKVFQILRKNLIRSAKAQNYLKERKISDINEIGYNYRTIKELRDCIVFPLKDIENKIVSFYGRNINNNKNGRHYYTSNRNGLYPNYPYKDIETLILTESIIDAISIKQNTNYEVLALYGTNSLTKEHIKAILSLKNLKEIIFFLDGDESGKSAIEKYSKSLNQLLPEVTISKVLTPENEDANSLIDSHEKEILNHLIQKRKKIFGKLELKTRLHKCNKLDTKNPNYLKYNNKSVQITILGGVNLYPIDKLKVTLKIEKLDSHNPLHKIRHSIDLYNDDQTEKLINKTSERLEISTKELQIIITELIEVLENYREDTIESQKPKVVKRHLNNKRREMAINWLKAPNLLEKTNDLIGQSGVVGEETNRLLMYLIFTSRL